MYDCAAAGTWAEWPISEWPPAEGGARSSGRARIRADVLRSLLLDASTPVAAHGVQLRGARITGQLDLEDATLRCPLRLDRCVVAEPLLFNRAHASDLQLTVVAPAVHAEFLRVDHRLDLDAAHLDTIDLADAHIGGQLRLRGAMLTKAEPYGESLRADRLHVEGNAFLDEGFHANGAVRLPGAHINGLLSMKCATLSGYDTEGDSLIADALRVDGDAYFPELVNKPGAIRLNGVSIGGKLDLTGADLGEVQLSGTKITDALILSGATLSGVDINGNALIAEHLDVGGNALLDDEFAAHGAIRLFAAEITGVLSMTGAQLSGTDADGNSLVAVALQAHGGAFLGGEFRAVGGLRLVGASIGGQLSLRGAQLSGADMDGLSLAADRMVVDGSAVLDELVCAGAIRLVGAHITGQLGLRGAELSGGDDEGASLVADEMQVDNSALLSELSSSGGAVRLSGAHIAGQLAMRGAQLTGTDADGNSLFAEGMRVDADAYLDGGFTVTGAVRLAGSHISGQLSWAPASPPPYLDLAGARLGELVDEPDGWPHISTGGLLELDGLTYDTVSMSNGLASRLRWLDGQPDFAPQPYEQLVGVLRASGRETEARRVAMEKQRQLRKSGGLSRPARAWNAILGALLGHGYRMARPVWLLLGIITVSSLIFWYAGNNESMTPSNPAAARAAIAGSTQPAPSSRHCRAGYPCFNPATYAANVTFPLVRLPQADAWRPNEQAAGGTWYRVLAIVDTLAGWILGTFVVIGITGLARKD